MPDNVIVPVFASAVTELPPLFILPESVRLPVLVVCKVRPAEPILVTEFVRLNAPVPDIKMVLPDALGELTTMALAKMSVYDETSASPNVAPSRKVIVL